MVFTREQGICAFHLLDKPLAYYPHVAEKQFNTWPNDILVFPEDVPKAITLIQQAVQNQELDAEVIKKSKAPLTPEVPNGLAYLAAD